MIGAGVFAAYGPAARAAGSGLLVGLAVAAVVAYCNATSSAQLAAAYPRVRRHLPLRPRGARRLVGLPRRLGLHGRQDRLLRGDGADVRGVRRARGLAARRSRAGRRGRRWPLVNCARRHPHRPAHPGPRLAGPGRRWSWPCVACFSGGSSSDLARLGVARRRALRRAAVGRAAVLRLRRLCADRHARRGGARPRPRRSRARSCSRWPAPWCVYAVVAVAVLSRARCRSALAASAAPRRRRRRATSAAVGAGPVVRAGAALAVGRVRCSR